MKTWVTVNKLEADKTCVYDSVRVLKLYGKAIIYSTSCHSNSMSLFH